MYFLLASVMELAASVSWMVMGLELMPHFDRPWLTTSISEFWSARWNLVIGALLRDLVYDPILEGHPVKTEAKMRKSHNPLRQTAAVLCTFLASGVMHWAVIYYIVRRHALYNLASFCIHGVVVIAERLLCGTMRHHAPTKARWNAVPWPIKAFISQCLLHGIAHKFFWKDLVLCKETRQLATALDVANVRF